MINDFKGKEHHIIYDRTDMRKGIDDLAILVQGSFNLNPHINVIFLFFGWSCYRYKCLYFDGDEIALVYKLLILRIAMVEK